MGALHRFEQRLETMVTGAFARAFRSAVQPMEIAAALQREVDNSAQILSRDRRLAPNDFTIDLSASDFDRLSEYGQTLSSELAAMLHEHAQEQHYMFAGPLKLNFTRADDLTTGRFRVRSAASAQVSSPTASNVTDTTIRKASIFLEVGGLRQPLEGPGLVIGRGSNAGIRIEDPGVSRRHVEFRPQHGDDGPSVVVMDLGSTNGTLVNGQRVQHAVVGDGAVIQVGGTRVVVHISASSEPASSAPAQPPTQLPPATPPVGPGPSMSPTPPPSPDPQPPRRQWSG